MSIRLRRRLIDLACRALQATLPTPLQRWGWAIRCEAAAIPDDSKALLFTLGSLCGLMPRAVASRLPTIFASPVGDHVSRPEGSTIMHIVNAATRRPRALGIVCLTSAVLLGTAYMAIAGAPMRYLGVNLGALIIGLTLLLLLERAARSGQGWTDGANLMMAGALLATALFGSQADGIARWVYWGGLAMQPSLILLPTMLVAFSRFRNVPATVSIVAAAVAMALQPDRAMAAMLVICLTALAVMRPDRHVCTALAASAASFAATLIRADRLPAIPYVDQILYSSFDLHAVAGLAVLGGLILLVVPSVIGWRRAAESRAIYVAFGAVWFAAILAAALGNYPTPVVGYGGSAIIGYALSLLALPKFSSANALATAPKCGAIDDMPTDGPLSVALA